MNLLTDGLRRQDVERQSSSSIPPYPPVVSRKKSVRAFRSGAVGSNGQLERSASVIATCESNNLYDATMAPLPPTTQTLTTRLAALTESNKSAGQLIQRLAKLDFQPGSQPLDGEEGDVRLELSAEIHETLKGIEDELELLRQEVEDVLQQGAGAFGKRRDSAREGERSRLAVLLARLTEDLRS